MSEPGKSRRGLGRVYQRGGVYWIQFSFRGKKVRESSHSNREADAVRLLKKRIGEMGQGKTPGTDHEKVTFEDLAVMLENDYRTNGRKSLDRALRSVKNLRAFFGLSRAVDITTDRINAYIRSRQEAGAMAATIRNELAALKRMFSLAVQAERLAHRPHVPSIHVSNARQGFFEEADFKAVLSHLPEEVHSVAQFAYLTGWRKGEILTLTWKQVDFEAGTARLEPGTTKNGEGRTFPFVNFPSLKELLTRQWERSAPIGTPWVFHRAGKPITTFRGSWENACMKAGVPDRLFHDLRRTAVRNLERAGVPRSVAMRLTGHKTESIYRRYAIVSEPDLSEGVRKLAALQSTPPLQRTGTERAQLQSETTKRALLEESHKLLNTGAGGRT